MSATAQLPRPGDMIAGKYVLERLLGQGGMGAVFAARHLKLAKSVAIKIMLADAGNPEASQRFINEGRAAANIQNEHVVRVDDVDEEMGYAYMVLELLEGQDLAQILEGSPGKRIAPHLAVSYVMQGLKGVAQAHALGIVHRDLKPSNLFLAKRKDGSAVVKVLDFGISKATGQGGLNAAPNALTSTKAMLGSPLYMSPEQLRNAKGVDHRADIWAMGVILYELITGALPFMGDNLGELFANILESDPLPLRQRAGDAVPLGLNDVVMRCLQRKPEQRFQSAAELMQALAPFEHAGVVGIGAGTNVGLGALGGTAFLPNANLQTGQQSAAQPVAHALSAAGTGPQPQPPMRAVTASQPNLTPPQFVQTTGSGWQQGSPPIAGLPKSRTPLILGVFGAVALIGSILGIVAWKASTRPKEDPTAAHPPPPASSSLAGVEPPASTKPVDPPPPESASAPMPAVSAPAPAPLPPPTPVHHPTVTRPQPQPQPVAQPVPAPQPKPQTKPGQPSLEGNR
ncbi:MAG: serine/threonine-protein kinase [Labilithrix sp.]